jgi:sugar-phosphatase
MTTLSPSAILSDLDGVLVDSGAAVEAAWATWARSHDLDPALLHGRFHGVRSLPAPAVLVTADRVTHGKPDPEGYALAARELGVDPAACVVFEDAPAGIAAARAAGAQAIGITTTHTADELRAAGAADVAPSVAGALALLGLQPQL